MARAAYCRTSFTMLQTTTYNVDDIDRKSPFRFGSESFGDSFGSHSSGSSASPVHLVRLFVRFRNLLGFRRFLGLLGFSGFPGFLGFPGFPGFLRFPGFLAFPRFPVFLAISRISWFSTIFIDFLDFREFQNFRFSPFSRFHSNGSCQGCGSDRFGSQRFGSSGSGSFRGLPATVGRTPKAPAPPSWRQPKAASIDAEAGIAIPRRNTHSL